MNKKQIKILRFLEFFKTIFPLCGRGALPLQFYDAMVYLNILRWPPLKKQTVKFSILYI